jgi:predicted nucleic acid-binding protein
MHHRRAVMADSSFFYALLDKRDAFHNACKQLEEQAEHKQVPIVAINFVVAEAHALILSRLGRDAATAWLEAVEALALIERVTVEDEARAKDIIRRYDDKDFSYTDACCFAVMERLDMRVALSADEHFVQYGKFIVLPLMGTELPDNA